MEVPLTYGVTKDFLQVFPKWSHIEEIVWSEPYHSMELPEWLNTTGSGMLDHSTEVRPWPVPIKCTRGQRSNQCDFSNSKSKEEEVPRSGVSRLELVSAFKRSVKWIGHQSPTSQDTFLALNSGKTEESSTFEPQGLRLGIFFASRKKFIDKGSHLTLIFKQVNPQKMCTRAKPTSYFPSYFPYLFLLLSYSDWLHWLEWALAR